MYTFRNVSWIETYYLESIYEHILAVINFVVLVYVKELML